MAPKDKRVALLEALNGRLRKRAVKLGIERKTPTIIGVTEDGDQIIRISGHDELETCMIMQRYNPFSSFCLRMPAKLQVLKRRAEAAGFKVEVES